MPATQGIIDSISFPPIGLLLPVLDTGGPYYAGSWSFNTFTHAAAGTLPAGTSQVHGTYGVIAQVTGAIPSAWGRDLGFDSGGALGNEGDYYHNRFCQVVPMHQLLGGALFPMDIVNVHRTNELVLWPFRLIGGDQLGLHVSPGINIELYYMCVL